MKIQQTFSNEYTPDTESDVQSKSHTSIIDNYISRLQNDEVSGVYPQSDNVPEKIDLSNNIDKIIENKQDKEM